MKYIEIDKDGLLSFIKQHRDSWGFKKAISIIENNSDIKRYLKENNFNRLYSKLFHEQTESVISAITMLLLAANIDILEYLTYIPAYCFYNVYYLNKIIIPKNTSFIGTKAFYVYTGKLCFEGTKEEFIKIDNASIDSWSIDVSEIICSDGVLKIDKNYGGVVIP